MGPFWLEGEEGGFLGFVEGRNGILYFDGFGYRELFFCKLICLIKGERKK